jgi:hypothetical protein
MNIFIFFYQYSCIALVEKVILGRVKSNSNSGKYGVFSSWSILSGVVIRNYTHR